MDLRRLTITHFRNFGSGTEVELPPGGLLVAAAPNATGKTNFLESISVLLRGKSFRAAAGDCVAWGQEGFLLQGTLTGTEGEARELAVQYRAAGRKLRIDESGVPASMVGFYARYPLVVFLPEDTFLFSRGPAVRRSFMNQVLVAHRQYVSILVQYHRVLKARNSLLRRSQPWEAVRSWTELLAEHAHVLWRYREGLATFFDDQLSAMHERLSGERLPLRVVLQRGARRADSFLDDLTAQFTEEQRYGYTLSGPHRDDLVVTAEGHPAGLALSRGQLRTVVAALKMLTHSYVHTATGEEPLLLLDDVLSEMDERRSRAFLDNLPATQALLTCAAVPEALRARDDVYLLDLREILAQAQPARRERVRAAV